VNVEMDFIGAQQFVAPEISVNGDTPMGAAIEKGLELVRSRKDVYKSNGIAYYRPCSNVAHLNVFGRLQSSRMRFLAVRVIPILQLIFHVGVKLLALIGLWPKILLIIRLAEF
jgi:hypothetical protein